MLADVIPASKRSTGFGLFYTVFGVAWFIGSALMGFLYDKSLATLIVFSVASQLLALPVIFYGAAGTKRR
jgi:predicted MFS family arabinose efflux permease